jgi:hypothetical protein
LTTQPDHLYTASALPFLAMTRGHFHWAQGEQRVQLSILPLGELFLPSGQLLIEDPFHFLRPHLNRHFPAPLGRHSVFQTMARLGTGDSEPLRAAYLSVVFNEELMNKRRQAQKDRLHQGQDPSLDRALLTPLFPTLPRDSFSERDWERMSQPSVPVLTGTLALADLTRFEGLMPSDLPDIGEGWLETVFDHGVPGSWFDALDNEAPFPPGTANIQLPEGHEEDRIVLARTGWPNGTFPICLETSDQGEPLALHIDFDVLPSST